MSKVDVVEILKKSDALLEGHFLLSSGKHSNRYVQCAKVLRYPEYAAQVLSTVVDQIKDLDIDLVVGPAMGGVIVSYELGRQLNKEAVFTERKDGVMQLRRGFEVKPGAKIIISEDVVTTGKSTLETKKALEELGGEVIGVACIADRTSAPIGMPIYSAIKLDIQVHEADDCPLCKEGKIELIAEIDGLLKIDVDKLRAVNSLGEMMIATRHTNTTVKKGDKLVGTRIIPLLIEQEKMEKAKEVAGDRPILSLIPFKKKKVGIVTTGNEVFYGRIKDTFGPVVAEKVKEFGADVIGQTIVNDDMEKITKAVEEFIEQGADMVLCTGGMSVDPDDKTPGAIKNTGARIVSYGAPVLPGAMMLLAYYEKDGKELPIVGLPGCVMYAKRTVFDLVLPRLMADDMVTSDDLAGLGLGGLCLSCDVCTFPNCGFGKGV